MKKKVDKKGTSPTVNVYEGAIELQSVGVKFCNNISALKIDGKNVDYEFRNGIIHFSKTKVSGCMEIRY